MKLLILFILSFSFNLKAQVFKVGYLFDSQNARWIKDQVLVVKDGIIVEMNPREFDSDLSVIDLSGQWVIPGLIDSHTHLFLNDETFSYDFSVGLKKWVNKDKDVKMALAFKRARQMKEAGFILARDLGNQGQVGEDDISSIKDILVVSSGAGFAPQLGQLPPNSPKELSIEYRKLSDGLAKHPYPIVKLFADEEPNHQFAKLEDLKTFTTIAHQQNKLVAVHAILEKGIELALASGADTLEHGSFMTEDQLLKLASTSMIFVPTNYQTLFLNPKRKTYFHEDSAKDFKHNCSNIRKAHRLGIPIAFGSDHYFDFPNEHFGENLIEILIGLKKCGLTNNELLKLATFNSAHTQNVYRVGKLAPGYLAHFNVYKKSPALDLMNLLKIEMIYRDGKLVQ